MVDCAGEKVLDSIAKPAIATRGSLFTLLDLFLHPIVKIKAVQNRTNRILFIIMFLKFYSEFEVEVQIYVENEEKL